MVAERMPLTEEQLKNTGRRVESDAELIHGTPKIVEAPNTWGRRWDKEKKIIEHQGGGAKYKQDEGVVEPRLHVTDEQVDAAREEMVYDLVGRNGGDGWRAVWRAENDLLLLQSEGQKLTDEEDQYLRECRGVKREVQDLTVSIERYKERGSSLSGTNRKALDTAVDMRRDLLRQISTAGDNIIKLRKAREKVEEVA